MRYSKKVSKDGVFTCVKNEPISQCENHEILSVTQEGKYNTFFITYKCKIHDETIKRAKGHVLSKGCVACTTEGLRKSREKLFLRHIKANTDKGDFELISVYDNAKQNIDIRHNVCGRVFTTTSDKFTRNYKCLYCTNNMYNCETLQKYHNRYSNFYLSEGFEIVLDTPNKKIIDRTNFKVKHLSCDKEFKVSHDKFYNSGSRCPICNNKNSRVHAIVCAILEVNNIEFEVEYRFDDCKNEYTLPFDFRVNISSSKFILIEVDGQQHYKELTHGYFKDNQYMVKRNDKIKNKYCKDNNIKLYRMRVGDHKTIQEVFDTISEILPINKIPDYKTVDKFNTNKILYTDAKIIRELYLKGEKIADISKKYECSDSWIWKILKYKIYPDVVSELKSPIQELLSFNNHKPPRRDSKLLKDKFDIFKLRKQGVSFEKIGKLYNISGSAVRTFVIRNS